MHKVFRFYNETFKRHCIFCKCVILVNKESCAKRSKSANSINRSISERCDGLVAEVSVFIECREIYFRMVAMGLTNETKCNQRVACPLVVSIIEVTVSSVM